MRHSMAKLVEWVERGRATGFRLVGSEDVLNVIIRLRCGCVAELNESGLFITLILW